MAEKIVNHPQLGQGKLLKTYMSGYEWEVLFESGKRFRLPSREFTDESLAANQPHLPKIEPRSVFLEGDQFQARQTLESLRFGIVPVQDVEILTIGLEPEQISLNRAIARSRESGGDTLAVIGDYGFGKSHFIELAARRALRENFLVMNTSLDLLEVPPSKPFHIYRTLTASTRYPGSDQRGLAPLLNQARENFGQLGDFLNSAPMGEGCPLRAALNTLFNCGVQGANEDLIYWLGGQAKPTTRMKACLKKPPTLYQTGEIARQYTYLLSGLSLLATYLGYSGLAVLIDESEHYSLLRANQRERADSFFKAMIYAALDTGRIDGTSIPYHYKVQYPVTYSDNANLFFLFALTESENQLPVEDWLSPQQIMRLDDRFIEKDIRKFMETVRDYHGLAYAYTPAVEGHIESQIPPILAKHLSQHRINLRELIRVTVTVYDLLFLHPNYAPHTLVQDLKSGFGM